MVLKKNMNFGGKKMFRMSWYDFKNKQFKVGDKTYYLGKRSPTHEELKTSIMFLLNIHKGVFVTIKDITNFIYTDVHEDLWPEYPFIIIRTMVSRIRKILPPEVKIVNHYTFGYMLVENAEV